MNGSYLSPTLTDSVFSFRIRLAERRLSSYPLDDPDFIMLDLEHPVGRVRHAHQCTGDLTGRTVEFLCTAHEVLSDGKDAALDALTRRVLLRATGDPTLFRRLLPALRRSNDPALYRLVADRLDAYLAAQAADPDGFFRDCGAAERCCSPLEGLAWMLSLTGDRKYLPLARPMAEASLIPFEGSHSHSLLSVLRSILLVADVSCDPSLAELVRPYRAKIFENEYPDGSVSEIFCRSERNEGCSIADWVMLNLRWFDVTGEDSALDAAEHSLFNALFFNQFITGGFGHRCYERDGRGYSTEIEEAWWCCTQTGGMALCEFAQHAVRLVGGELVVNFPVPGVYRLSADGRELRVTITSEYPARWHALIRVEGDDEMNVRVRVPHYVRNFSLTENTLPGLPGGRVFTACGDIGHYPERRGDGYVLKYGPLMLAPMIYDFTARSGAGLSEAEGGVPDGYLPESLSGNSFALVQPDDLDANGFWPVAAGTELPEWMYFDDGIGSRTGTNFRAPANVTLLGEDGAEHRLCFHPLCYATSNLTLCHVPMTFDLLRRRGR